MSTLSTRVLGALAAILAILLVGCLMSSPGHSEGLKCLPLAITHIRDGDTVEAGELVIRLAGVDAPETWRPACERERMLGKLATGNLAMLVKSAEALEYCPTGEPPSWGRTIAHVLADGRNVGDQLIVDGYARRWTGRKESWCDD